MRNWETVDINNISGEEFFSLIERNREHLAKTFPRTLKNCEDYATTVAFLKDNCQRQKNGENYFFYLRDTIKGNLTGYIVIKNIDRYVLKCELAYFIDKDYQGRGIITQTVAHVVNFCFDNLELNKVFICTSLENIGSQKVALKNGFKQEGVLKQEFKNGQGMLEDIVYFGLVKSDYTNER